LLELQSIFKNPLGLDGVPVVQIIHEVDHANVDVVGVETSQKIADELIA